MKLTRDLPVLPSTLPAYVTPLTLLTLWLLPQVVTSSNFEDHVGPSILRPDLTQFPHLSEPFDEVLHEKLSINLLESSPSSLLVTWRLSNTTHVDSTLQATAVCETGNGKILSNTFTSAFDSFHFQHLSSDTKYVICVHMLEKSTSMNTSILHYNCQAFSTIPVVRPDSLIGVFLTLGYLFAMGGIGYLVWWRKAAQFRDNEEEERRRIEEEEEEEEGEGEADKKLTSHRTESRDTAGSSTSQGGGEGERNGAGSSFKNTARGVACCTGPRNAKFQDIAEEHPIQLNVEDREISF